MMRALLAFAGVLLSAQYGLSCDSRDYLGADHEPVPCVEIPACPATSSIIIDQLSTGAGDSIAITEAHLCYSDENLEVAINAYNDSFIRNDVTACNGAIYNQAVAELFITPLNEADLDPHCYYEIDISPHNVMFESSIVNRNLDATSFGGTTLDCETSGVEHRAAIHDKSDTWSSRLSVPFSLISSPLNCGYPGYGQVTSAWRFNMYRIRLLQDVSKCSSSVCEYMAFSPTMVSPPFLPSAQALRCARTPINDTCDVIGILLFIASGVIGILLSSLVTSHVWFMSQYQYFESVFKI